MTDKFRNKTAILNPFVQHRGFLWEARTRILVCYTALMTGFIVFSIPIFSQLALNQVETRVQGDLNKDIKYFDSFIKQQNEPKNKIELANIFQKFLLRYIPEDDTFFITMIDGKFYNSSPRAKPKPLQEDSELMMRWAKMTQHEDGVFQTNDPSIGNILYHCYPVTINGQVRGMYVVAHTTAGEIAEATDIVSVVIKVLLTVLGLAFILAWIASGKILAPLRNLIATARSINEIDLTQRIPVKGTGEMAELAETFNAMLERLQVALVSQRALINDAGHELRTPITIIRGHLELIGDDPIEQQETIELVIDELDRMSRLVNDLLILAKSERSDFLQLEILDIYVLTQELYHKAIAIAPRNWQLEAKGRGLIKIDRQRITQAIMNLAVNATQHTLETDTITLGSLVKDNYLCLWVSDTGEGIQKADQQRIFERFARGSFSRPHCDGSGLGLSIVKAIAIAHNGYVELESEPGIGSTFTLVLPLKSF
ncbi:two-component sensor histidine kinase [Aphanothece hegewaldii CCALA 016]|uniref:histidine kinase n=1 Tax=Aphanothece hegewaldii CCALA 016 TaxID=2107694 RepID=A0A2T1LTJ2_9CHRO|nr:HAMP domain-containing sensor histidine kinase [Aphanothece hegewaldii]PSF34228.1 two-component sensor histidine kinase [Aphanothece hegewaldii CCALA 016]